MSTPTPLPHTHVDVAVVGGGINGVGIARDLAGRGAKVLLCEKDDLAGHTSSRATKLIHGGLRYLEHHEFGLVRKALREREVLLRSAPHVSSALRLVIPHDAAMRPAWLIRLGLFLYDHLAPRQMLPGCESIRLDSHVAGVPLKPGFRRGFVYSDGVVDDARLVVLNALDARERGAEVLTRTRCQEARRRPTHWELHLTGEGGHRVVRAKTLVNAAGPWAAQFLHDCAGQESVRSLRHVKGSHIVVRRQYDHDFAYLFQNPDGRIIFVIPYEKDFTLIGTTDVEYAGPLDDVRISAEEVHYLCEQASRCLRQPVNADHVVWAFSGVRPLLNDDAANPSKVTRDYRLELDCAGAPILTAWGGKLTTYRALSEEAADMMCTALGIEPVPWTAHAVLPGGDLARHVPADCPPSQWRAAFERVLQLRYPRLPARLLRAWAGRHGTRTFDMLGSASQVADLGAELVPGLYECEAHYLVEQEWAFTAEDILWRRTKLGLHASRLDTHLLEQWLDRRIWDSGAQVAAVG